MAQHAPAGLAYGGKGLGQNVVEGLAVIQPLLEFRSLGFELLVGHGGIFGVQRLYLVHDRFDALELLVGMTAEYRVNKAHVLRFSLSNYFIAVSIIIH
jgi:hypothetical protein